ncbi:MAG: hypothetical protein ACK55I_35510, partial [bacterium]
CGPVSDCTTSARVAAAVTRVGGRRAGPERERRREDEHRVAAHALVRRGDDLGRELRGLERRRAERALMLARAHVPPAANTRNEWICHRSESPSKKILERTTPRAKRPFAQENRCELTRRAHSSRGGIPYGGATPLSCGGSPYAATGTSSPGELSCIGALSACALSCT